MGRHIKTSRKIQGSWKTLIMARVVDKANNKSLTIKLIDKALLESIRLRKTSNDFGKN